MEFNFSCFSFGRAIKALVMIFVLFLCLNATIFAEKINKTSSRDGEVKLDASPIVVNAARAIVYVYSADLPDVAAKFTATNQTREILSLKSLNKRLDTFTLKPVTMRFVKQKPPSTTRKRWLFTQPIAYTCRE